MRLGLYNVDVELLATQVDSNGVSGGQAGELGAESLFQHRFHVPYCQEGDGMRLKLGEGALFENDGTSSLCSTK
ncbi:unnamed protein product [Linum trigynum]|uniref:Uncharacterized protein n=1 Tax=Linum trigynum TaxID=586398 RepID=A0AAV2DBN7_9ROSI